MLFSPLYLVRGETERAVRFLPLETSGRQSILTLRAIDQQFAWPRDNAA